MNPVASMQINAYSHSVECILLELRSLMAKSADVLGFLELDGAVEGITKLVVDVDDSLLAIDARAFLPLPGADAASAVQDLAAATRVLQATLAQLMTATNHSNDSNFPVIAGELHLTLNVMFSNTRSIVADMKNEETQRQLLNAVRNVYSATLKVLSEMQSPVKINDAQKQKRILALSGSISNFVHEVTSLIPGQRDVDVAVQKILSARKSLTIPQASSGKIDESLRRQIDLDSKALMQFGTQLVVAAQTNPQAVQNLLSDIFQTYQRFVNNVLNTVSAFDAAVKKPVSSSIDRVTSLVTNLLLSCLFNFSMRVFMPQVLLLTVGKTLLINSASSGARMQSNSYLQELSEAINDVLAKCSTISPQLMESEKAVTQLRASLVQLEDPTTAVNDCDYYECFEVVVRESKVFCIFI
jgi:hypothetical protein